MALLQVAPTNQFCSTMGHRRCSIYTSYVHIPDTEKYKCLFDKNKIANFCCRGEVRTSTPCMVGFYQDEAGRFDANDILVALSDLKPTLKDTAITLGAFNGAICLNGNFIELRGFDEMPCFFIEQRLQEFALRRRIIELRGIEITDVFGYNSE